MFAKDFFPSVLFQTPLLQSLDLFITLFTKLFLVHFFILFISLGYCLLEGTSLKCKKPKAMLLLSILGTITVWLHSFSNMGSNSIGATMLFSINIVWVTLFFFFLGIKISKASLIGVFLSLRYISILNIIINFVWIVTCFVSTLFVMHYSKNSSPYEKELVKQ